MSATASVPLMITAQMRSDLAELGLSPEQISELTPAKAWEILKTADLPVPIVTYNHTLDTTATALNVNWGQLAKLLTKVVPTQCTVDTCIGKECPHKNGGMWSPAILKPNTTRADVNILNLTALSIDLDGVVVDGVVVNDLSCLERMKADGLAFVVHSTHQHRKDKPRVRVVVPISRPLLPLEYKRARAAFCQRYGVKADDVAGALSTAMYTPRVPSDADIVNDNVRGRAVDVDDLLKDAPAVAEPSKPTTNTEGKYPDGSRTAFLTSLAGKLRVRGLDGPTMLAVLRDASQRLCDPPYDDDKLVKLAASYAKYSTDAANPFMPTLDEEMAPAGHTPVNELLTLLNKAPAEPPADLPPCEPGYKYVHKFDSDWHSWEWVQVPDPDDPWNKQVAQALLDVQTALGTGGRRNNKKMFVSARDLMKSPKAATHWLVRGLATQGGLLQAAGKPKVTKTWTCTEVAVCVAAGLKVFGEFETGAPKRVHYFYAEDAEEQVKARVRALMRFHGLSEVPEGLHMQPKGLYIDVLNDEDLAVIVASVRADGGTDLLCLDPLRDISSADEDKSGSMAVVMRRLRLLGDLLGCTVAFVHHMKKGKADKDSPAEGSRGSNSIHGSTDSGLYMTDLKGDGESTFITTVTPQIKGARSAGKFTLTLEIEDDEDGSAVCAKWTVSRGGDKAPKSTKTLKEMDKLDVVTRHAWHAIVKRLIAQHKEDERKDEFPATSGKAAKYGIVGFNKLKAAAGGGAPKVEGYLADMERLKLIIDTGDGYRLLDEGWRFASDQKTQVKPPAVEQTIEESQARLSTMYLVKDKS